MRILKRDGTLVKLSFDKITYRLKKLCNDRQLGILKNIDPDIIVQKVVNSIYDGVPSTELDEEAARIAISMTEHSEYAQLASRIVISNSHKNTSEIFSEIMERAYSNVDKSGNSAPLIADHIIDIIREHKNTLNHVADFQKDYNFDYFGFKTIEKSYVLKLMNKDTGKMEIIERPQHMYLRVALGIHQNDIENVIKTYNLMSDGMYTHATPTLFNSGTRLANLSSCFLIGTNDSIEGIFKTMSDTAKISKVAGGIGLHVSNVRSKGSIIRGTHGQSDGIIPMLKVYNSITTYVNQCFAPDTMIYTDSELKPIYDITLHDRLMTIDGSFKAINEIITNEIDQQILELTTVHSTKPVKVTREHQIYAWKKNTIKPEFYSADQLTTDDHVAYPIPLECVRYFHEKLSHLCNAVLSDSNDKVVDSSLYFRQDDKLWTKITDIKYIQYTGFVYDFNMQDNHNYVTDIGIVHNSGRRKGSFAIYLEPFHADVMEFLDLRKNQGHEDLRARDLFLAMWMSDCFMKCVEDDASWYLMCPDECPNLTETYGKEHSELYWSYVEQGRYKEKIKARELWDKILDSQIETGTPYLLYKDAINEKTNQKNIGTIKSSNLCAEIAIYSDDLEYGTCNLNSIALPKYVVGYDTKKPKFDFEKLHQVIKYTILCMNRVIDVNYYPTPETKKSNLSHRPIGCGVQGLHDVYFMMRYPFESEKAKQLNKEIFETIYFACLEGSMELAKTDGAYSSFEGSPASQGKLQFDLWAERENLDLKNYLSKRWDWDALKENIKTYGLRNSLLTTCMPTASTSQILNNTEAIEPIHSNLFTRRTLSGEFIVINKFLVRDLQKMGIWNKEMKDRLVYYNGSVQKIAEIPDDMKELYKTVWEIKQKYLIDQSADRGVFIDHTQSLNLFMAEPTHSKLTSMHFYAWKKGLKTGIYYLRSKPSANASKFSLDATLEKQLKLEDNESNIILQCAIDNKEDCMMCSS